jgi:hypothetical protein
MTLNYYDGDGNLTKTGVRSPKVMLPEEVFHRIS